MLLFGMAQLGFVFSLSTLEHTHLGVPPILRAPTRASTCMLALDPLHPDFPSSARGVSHLKSSVLLFGLARFGFVFSLSILEYTHTDISITSRISAYSGAALVVLDPLHLRSPTLLRRFGCLELAMTPFGMSRVGLLLSLPDSVLLAFLMIPRIFAQSVPTTPVLDLLHSGLSPFVRFHSRSRFASLFFSIARLSFVSSSFVSEHTHLGSLPLARALARCDLVSLALDLLHSGIFMISRSCS